MKNSNGIIGNRTRDLPACRAVPQPTAPPRASHVCRRDDIKMDLKGYVWFNMGYRVFRCEHGNEYSDSIKTDNFLATWRQSIESVATGSRYTMLPDLQ